jgi:signal transduction histidine kinase
MKNTGDEVGRLSATFDEMIERLEAAFLAEKQFTSDASHELRTPVAVITAYAEMQSATTRVRKNSIRRWK